MLRHASVWEFLPETDAHGAPTGSGNHTRWIDICTPLVVVRERALMSCCWLVHWGGTVRWALHEFKSAEDARQAVDVRLRQLGYILPEDGPREAPPMSASLLIQLDTQRAHIEQLSQLLRESEQGWRTEKDRRPGLEKTLDGEKSPGEAVALVALADVSATLNDRTKERDALLNDKWYGPWTACDESDPATSEGVEMVRYLNTGFRASRKERGSVVWQTPKGWSHTPRIGPVATPAPTLSLAMQAADQVLIHMDKGIYLVGGPYEAPQPAIMWCPKCNTVHVDVGDLTWLPHRSHECHSCKHVWPVGGPGEFYVGIAPAGAK